MKNLKLIKIFYHRVPTELIKLFLNNLVGGFDQDEQEPTESTLTKIPDPAAKTQGVAVTIPPPIVTSTAESTTKNITTTHQITSKISPLVTTSTRVTVTRSVESSIKNDTTSQPTLTKSLNQKPAEKKLKVILSKTESKLFIITAPLPLKLEIRINDVKRRHRIDVHPFFK